MAFRIFRMAAKHFTLTLSEQMAYKGDFLIKLFAGAAADFVGPLVAILIYAATPGIPGWAFEEFLLFQGTLILVFSLGKFMALDFPGYVLGAIWEGDFDKYLLRPYDSLKQLLARSLNPEALIEVLLGAVIIIYSFGKLGLTMLSLNFAYYLLLIAAAVAVQQAAMIAISAMAFLVIKSDALVNFWHKFTDFARYPISVYSPGLKFFLTFVVPVAVSASYPSEILLRGASPGTMAALILPVVLFYAAAIGIWRLGIRNYTSAGG
jgi:ABC-2 type transport system permease protein